MRMQLLMAVVVLIGVACQSTRVIPNNQSRDSQPRPRAPRSMSPESRFDPRIVGPWYRLVGLPEFQIQGSSKRLVALIGSRPRLEVEALRSERGTVALKFVEKATPKSQWGDVMTPAERRVFGAFAADRNMGDFLIVFTDILVIGGQDPIPMTGYRWKRADVEAYANCGIPSSGLDTCTRLFYTTPQMVLFPPDGGDAAGRGT